MSDRRYEAPLSWTVTLLASAYVAWTCWTIGLHVPTFKKTFTDIGAEVPALTKVALFVGQPAVVWPLGLLAIAFLVVKELRGSGLYLRLALSVVVFIVTALFSSVVMHAVSEPMRLLMEQVR